MNFVKLCVVGCCLPLFMHAQEGDEGYAILRFPTSARVSALGGYSVSLVEADPSLVFHNPALLGGETDNRLNMNYINYIADVNVGSVVFTKAFRERSAWGVGATYINYGAMKEMTGDNEQLGTFSVQDIDLHVFYSYDLSERWRGGLSLKTLYSTLAEYYSFGLAVDAGLSYFNPESDFSFGIALKSVGAELKAYYDERQRVPWDFQFGVTKRMAHAPIRFSATAMYLNQWKFTTVDRTLTSTEKGDSFIETALKHLVLGVELLPSDNLWIGVGLNPKTRMDMKLSSGNALSGFTIGAGLKVSRFDIGASVARYHPAATSFMVSLTMALSEMKP